MPKMNLNNLRRKIFILSCTVLLLASPCFCQTDSAINPVIEFKAVPLVACIENLASQTEINFMIDPHCYDGLHAGNTNETSRLLVTLRWEDLTAIQAFDRLLKEHGLFAIPNPQTGVTRITGTNQPPRNFDEDFIKSGGDKIVPLTQMYYVRLEDALNQLAIPTGLKLKLDLPVPLAMQKLSFRFQKLTVRQALAAICENYSLRITKTDQPNSWRISPD